MSYDLIITLGAIGAVNIMGWLSPGPNMLAVINASISKGRRTGFATALGVSLGGVLWAGAAVMGAASVFVLFPKAVFLLRIIGAGYLVWLGIKSLRSAAENKVPSMDVAQVKYTYWAAFRTGFFVMLTNPKAIIFFSSIYTAVLPEGAPLWLLVLIVCAGQFQTFIQHCITATVFSSNAVVRKYQAASRAITGAIGVLYCGLGLGIATDAIRRLS